MFFCRPDFYDCFHCVGGACTDTCCAGWEIEVDEQTARSYRRMDTPFGREIAASLVEDDEGTWFRLTDDGRCPFLNREGLCRIIQNCGEESLCDICREHPRFYNWYGSRTEAGLGLSCEEAVRLLFHRTEPIRFLTEEIPDRPDEGNPREEAESPENHGEPPDRQEKLFLEQGKLSEAQGETAGGQGKPTLRQGEAPRGQQKPFRVQETEGTADFPGMDEDTAQVLRFREEAFRIVSRREVSISRRICGLLDFAEELQAAVSGGQGADPQPGPGREPASALSSPAEDAARILDILEKLDIMTADWSSLLAGASRGISDIVKLARSVPECGSCDTEYLLTYFLYRYFGQCALDGDVVGKVRFAVLSCLIIRLLTVSRAAEKSGGKTGAGQPAGGLFRVTEQERNTTVRLYSKEIEYCEENLEELWKKEHSEEALGTVRLRRLAEALYP
ncbi:MAG: flagellin lysine-N-methylase [Lachnospiraceae bacterium]|jgi:lysine-N-methylase